MSSQKSIANSPHASDDENESSSKSSVSTNSKEILANLSQDVNKPLPKLVTTESAPIASISSQDDNVGQSNLGAPNSAQNTRPASQYAYYTYIEEENSPNWILTNYVKMLDWGLFLVCDSFDKEIGMSTQNTILYVFKYTNIIANTSTIYHTNRIQSTCCYVSTHRR